MALALGQGEEEAEAATGPESSEAPRRVLASGDIAEILPRYCRDASSRVEKGETCPTAKPHALCTSARQLLGDPRDDLPVLEAARAFLDPSR